MFIFVLSQCCCCSLPQLVRSECKVNQVSSKLNILFLSLFQPKDYFPIYPLNTFFFFPSGVSYSYEVCNGSL